MMLVGRLFHARATVTGNDRSPMVLSRVHGTIRRGQERGHSRCRDSASSVQWSSSARYTKAPCGYDRRKMDVRIIDVRIPPRQSVQSHCTGNTEKD